MEPIAPAELEVCGLARKQEYLGEVQEILSKLNQQHAADSKFLGRVNEKQ